MNVAQHTRKLAGADLLVERRKLYTFWITTFTENEQSTVTGTVDGFRLADFIETRILARCRKMSPQTSIHDRRGRTRITVGRLR